MDSLSQQGKPLAFCYFCSLLTLTRRHVDVRDLPSLIPQSLVNATAQAIDAELFARISKLHDMIESGVVEIDSDNRKLLFFSSTKMLLSSCAEDEKPKTTCPFVLYGQLVPSPVPLHLMQELEAEMENPTGITTVSRPPLLVNVVMMSKECGILIEVREAEGLKSQRFWRKVTTCRSSLLSDAAQLNTYSSKIRQSLHLCTWSSFCFSSDNQWRARHLWLSHESRGGLFSPRQQQTPYHSLACVSSC